MSVSTEEAGLRLGLISDSAEVVAAVRLSCTAPHTVEVFSLREVVDDNHALSEAGKQIVDAATTFEAVLIDWTLDQAPLINTLCYHVRRRHPTPLIALCRGGASEQVAALAAGADDALMFPLYPALLRARVVAYQRLVEAVRASINGQAARAVPAEAPDECLVANLRIDQNARQVFINDQVVELTFREFALLTYFAEHVGTACSRDQILDHVWGIQFDTGTNMVDVYVYFLRRKLTGHGFLGEIQTVRGYGYRLARPEDVAAQHAGE